MGILVLDVAFKNEKLKHFKKFEYECFCVSITFAFILYNIVSNKFYSFLYTSVCPLVCPLGGCLVHRCLSGVLVPVAVVVLLPLLLLSGLLQVSSIGVSPIFGGW